MGIEHKLYRQLLNGWVAEAQTDWMHEHAEEWRTLKGAEGWYEVSNHGRIRRVRAAKSTYVGKILKTRLRRDSRCTVSMQVDGHKLTKSVHQCVADAFLGEQPDGTEINHIDGNPANNCIYNLEYCTPSQNALHAFSLGLFVARHGEDTPWAKLTDEQVIVIRACKGLVSQRIIATAFGVSKPVVQSIHKGRTWQHVAAYTTNGRTAMLKAAPAE